jgi:hypothetical protein
MKKFLTFIILAGTLHVNAQVPIEVKIESRPSSQGIQSAFEVMVPQATPKEAVELWQKTIIPKSLFKKEPKMEKVKDEWIVNNLLIADITTLPLNVYTQVNSFTGNIFFRVFLKTETGFLGAQGSSPQTTEAAVKFVRDFAVELYRQAVEKELKQEEKELKGLENNLEKLQKQNKSFNNKITDAQQDEISLKKEAMQNEEILRNQQMEIRLDSSGSKGKTAQEIMEKQAKDTQKDLQKSQKSQVKYSKKFDKNVRDQKNKVATIEKQKSRVREVQTKLNNIK